MWTRNVSASVLAKLFDHCPTTTHIDCHHSSTVFAEKVASHQINPIVVNSEEHYNLKGAGCFIMFLNCIMAVDVVKVNCISPNMVIHQIEFVAYSVK